MTSVVSLVDRAGRRSAAERIIKPGRNCWHVDRASRFYCIQDAAEYFRLVREALLSARRSVFSLGWDITAHTDLQPLGDASAVPTRLDKLLTYVARRRPHLRCYILTWDYGALYTLERDPLTRWRLGWRMPRGVRLGFDDHHPVGASHHQKIVVVDDQLAFCGGIDLTSHRWDTSAHRVDEPARKTPLGEPYEPYHDVQAMVTGPVAARLGLLARERWRAFGSQGMPPVDRSSEDLWPAGITPDLTDVDVAIARTLPGSDSQPAVRECEALFVDSIALAKQTIYIESQYFTNDKLAGALAARLREPDGPEVIVVSPQECHGWLEQSTMGTFRDGAFRQLLAADTHRRLRLVYPAASRSRGVPTFVHSKVMIVDDTLLRVGSANLSHRSMGMDTECDLAVGAAGSRDVRAGILRVRDRLLGEHLGLAADEVALGVRQRGSVRAFIDTRQHFDHTLVRIELPAEPVPSAALLRDAADPDEPMAFRSSVAALVPVVGVATGRLSLFAGLSGVAIDLLAIVAALFLGVVRGGAIVLAGAMAVAAVGYLAGRLIGAPQIGRWMSRRSYQSIRQFGADSVAGIARLMLAGVAGATSVHLAAGALRVPLASYVAGTAVALVLKIAALAGLGGVIREAIANPSAVTVLAAVGSALVLAIVVLGLRALFLTRQFAASVSGHRRSSAFG